MAQESWKKDTAETECQAPDGPVLGVNNCGFFGSAATNNLCSKCYRDLFMKQQPNASPVISVLEKAPPSSSIQFDSVVPSPEKVEGAISSKGTSSDDTSNHPAPNRCMACRKRIGLTGFNCRCGGTFCTVHHYSEKHDCSFDYRSAGRDAIAKANPVVKAEKIEKI